MGAFVLSPAQAADLCSAHCFLLKPLFIFDSYTWVCAALIVASLCSELLVRKVTISQQAGWCRCDDTCTHLPFIWSSMMRRAVCSSDGGSGVPLSLVHRMEPQDPQT